MGVADIPLMNQDKQIGIVLPTRTNVKPLYISPGHRIGIDSARNFVMASTIKRHLPENHPLGA